MQPKRKLGRGIFPSPSAYIEGKRSEFFQVPAPIWPMVYEGEPGIFPSPRTCIEAELGIFPSPRAYMEGAKSNISTYRRFISRTS